MSYTEIFKFNKQWDSESVANIKNSWRGGMAIWDFLGKKYCGHGASIFDLDQVKEIWDLADNSSVDINERIVLFTTFDDCLIHQEDIPKVITAFEEFEGNTSLPEQIKVLEELLADDCIAVGWHQNSISCEKWFDYNCLNQNEHFYLFDELEKSNDCV